MLVDKTYTIIVSENNWGPSEKCKLYVGRDYIKVVDSELNEAEYKFYEIKNAWMYGAFGRVEFTDKKSFSFRGKNAIDALTYSTYANETREIIDQIKALSKKKYERLSVNRQRAYITVHVFDKNRENPEIWTMNVAENCIEMINENYIKRTIDYSKIEKAEMEFALGCIRFRNGEKLNFTSGGTDNIQSADMVMVNTKKTVEAVNEALENHSTLHFLAEKVENSLNDEILINNIIKRKAVNQDYWRLYEESALKDNSGLFLYVDEMNTMKSVKIFFQNAICSILLGKYEDAKNRFHYMVKYYSDLDSQKYGSTDFFRLFAADVLINTKCYKDYLVQGIDLILKRSYRDDVDEKEPGNSFFSPGDLHMKKMYRLIDLLQLCRIGFIAGEYTQVVTGIERGKKLLREIESNSFREKSIGGAEKGNCSENREDGELGLRLELYGKTFDVLWELTQDTSGGGSINGKAVLEDLPRFFEEYVNPVPRKCSYFSIEEEVQWGLIFFLSCRRILGLFNDMAPHVGLRKFLG